MSLYYWSAVHKDEDSSYGVSIVDFPGCFSAGETLGLALNNASEALQLQIEGLREDNEIIPMPSSIVSVMDLDIMRSAPHWGLVELHS